MSWHYGGDPARTAKDAVRLLIGDTKPSAQLRSDEEVLFALAENAGNKYLAAAMLLDTLAAEKAPEVDKSVGDKREALSQMTQNYIATAKRYRLQARLLSATGAAPYAGGISKGGRVSQARDTDLVQPAFAAGQFDNRGAGDA